MPTAPVQRTVLFADLCGSTSLFGHLGNTTAAALLTDTIHLMGQQVREHGGTVIKTLGDGLMAVFRGPDAALQAVLQMQASLARHGPAAAVLRLHAAFDHGEIVELEQDCFGDSVNVAARLLEQAGDHEILVTGSAHARLSPGQQHCFRSLGSLQLRGRVQPCEVFQFRGLHPVEDLDLTGFAGLAHPLSGGSLRLRYGAATRVFSAWQSPVVLGRGPESSFHVPENCVSRSHARIEWHGGHFHFWDHSSNGSFVVFANRSHVAVHRSRCSLHGSGTLGLGSAHREQAAAELHFEVLACEPASASAD